MGKKLRKFNRASHRDLGYFFVAMIFIYSLSGIAINHLGDWNPSYSLKVWSEPLPQNQTKENINVKSLKVLIKELGVDNPYRKHYFPTSTTCKVFVKNGNMVIDLEKQSARIELVQRRAILHSVNWLHYNPNTFWKWFSDIFAVALMLLAISGMFILKGKTGLKWRGAILISLGIIVPVVFLILFYF